MDGTRRAGSVRPPRGRTTVPAVALMLSAAWILVAAVSVVAASSVARPARPVPVVALLLLFTVTQSFVLNVQIGREARSIYLSEIPIVIALLSIAPITLVAVRGVSALVSFGLIRRQYRHPHKLVFNVTLACAEAGVAAWTFTAVATSATEVPEVWLPAVLAAAAASAFTSVGV